MGLFDFIKKKLLGKKDKVDVKIEDKILKEQDNIIKEENNINSDNIKSILEILQDTLKNSTRKGRFGESMAINSLVKKYPSWKIDDTAGISHSGDCQVFTTKYGKILYELKTYTTNVGNEEIIKFKRDIEETNSNYGIFISHP